MALTKCNSKVNQQGRELVNHGTALFPVACYYDDLANEAVPWHWHDELEVFVVTTGTALVAVGEKKYLVKEGEGFFINAGVLHGAWDVKKSGCRFHSVVFHPRLVSGSIDSIFWQNYVQPLLNNMLLKDIHFDGSADWKQEAIEEIESAWQSCVKEPPGYEFQVRAILSRLIFLLSGYQTTAQVRPSEKVLRDEERIKTMLQYIQEHYAEELNTALIAGSALISESECLRCFRSTISTPPIQYVKQFRIQKATELLTATDFKVAEIGAQCGFQDTSYFTKTFRELKGCTPTQYRKMNGEV